MTKTILQANYRDNVALASRHRYANTSDGTVPLVIYMQYSLKPPQRESPSTPLDFYQSRRPPSLPERSIQLHLGSVHLFLCTTWHSVSWPPLSSSCQSPRKLRSCNRWSLLVRYLRHRQVGLLIPAAPFGVRLKQVRAASRECTRYRSSHFGDDLKRRWESWHICI